jgi:hypothetical protein
MERAMAGSAGHRHTVIVAAGALLLTGLLGLTARAQAPAAPPAKATLKAAAPQKIFQREALASDGVRLEAALKAEAAPSRPAAKARAEGEALMEAEKPAEALKPLGAAVAAEPGNPANWLA